MALVDDGLVPEERESLARAIAREVEEWDGEGFPRTEVLRPGPNFASSDTYWSGGTPSLATFVAKESLLIFHLLGQLRQLRWLSLPIAEWESSVEYTDFKDYIKSKSVVNDPAERAEEEVQVHVQDDILDL